MTVITQSDPIYTRDEQITALTQLVHDNEFVAQRRLARAIWNKANARTAIEDGDLASEQVRFTSHSFRHNALMLVHVPLATIYNRIRRITGKIK